MNYKKYERENYNIYLVKNKGFHDIFISICLTTSVSKEKVTFYNALSSVLTYATQKYPTSKDLLKKCQELYALSPKIVVNRFGNYLRFKLYLSTLDSIYIEKDNLIQNIILLNEVLNNPLTDGKSFNNKYFNIALEELKNEARTLKENTKLYSYIKLLEYLDQDKKDANYKITCYSDLEILNKITPENLYQSYLDLLKNSRVDIFVSGNITNEEEIVKAINEHIKIQNRDFKLDCPYMYHQKIKEKYEMYHEKEGYNQSKLAICCKGYDITEYENHYVSSVFNNLYGGGAISLLVREVREVNNLCYYIGSFYNKMDNLLMINSGINKSNYEKTVEIIKDVLQKIQKGMFTKKVLDAAKEEYLTEIYGLKDGNGNLQEYVYGLEIFHSKSIDERKKIIKGITKEDVIAFANKIHFDTIFFLEGEL